MCPCLGVGVGADGDDGGDGYCGGVYCGGVYCGDVGAVSDVGVEQGGGDVVVAAPARCLVRT